ncbi:hypothetical protein [Phocoenobacter skyensis]|uniref:Uncharacterized protein n=1 Tax=Phocoenobacter skyensis TaxID=97481 RepID=A0A1H7XSZ3_9PAST|nr:hypothetical protein [Pasteurella skyensis]MDP8078428.1 hypothetical protein [Pasteurella skyensis]MDP8084480.1 hypothetical protein [Pasteurella skyensis]MDP8184453.1 hypothetical protein [Pasteurella skyensis]QLB23281.1 hypothetical protein A6B44_08715 [Pasteurella skyensis]SEM36805.1 hypothetical protein SAMN05444853_11426 [Pasteurella skyensis]
MKYIASIIIVPLLSQVALAEDECKLLGEAADNVLYERLFYKKTLKQQKKRFRQFFSESKKGEYDRFFSKQIEKMLADAYHIKGNVDLSEMVDVIDNFRQTQEAHCRKARKVFIQKQNERIKSQPAYVVDWGYDFSGDNRLWGRNSVKLNNGRSVYMWLEKQSYGMKCYTLNIQGSFYGSASLCENEIKPYSHWSASCGNGQFWLKGNHVDVVKQIIRKCGNN